MVLEAESINLIFLIIILGLLHPQEHLKGHAGPDREHPKKSQKNPDLGHDRLTVLTRNPKKANTETSGYYGKMPGLSYVPQFCPVNQCEGHFPLSPLRLKLTRIGTRTVIYRVFYNVI